MNSVERVNERNVDLQISAALAAVGFFVSAMGAVVAILAAEFAVPAESLGWVGSAFGVGLLVVAASGRRLLRRGPRPALAGSAVIFTLGTLLVALSGNLSVIFTGTMLEGLGAATMVLAAPVMVTTAADVRLTRANDISSLIGIAAPLLVGAIAATGRSGRLALLLLIPMLVWLLWMLAASRGSQPARRVAANVAGLPEHARIQTVVRRWLAIVMAVSVEFCFVVWGVTRLRATGLETSFAAILGIAFPIGMAVGRLSGPWLIRRLPAVPFGAGAATAGTLLVAFTNHWTTVSAGFILAGIGVATLYPVTLAQLMAVPGLPAATGASVGALASGTAIVLAPVALSAVATVIDLRLAFLLPIPLLLLLVGLHRRPTRMPSEPAGRFGTEANPNHSVPSGNH